MEKFNEEVLPCREAFFNDLTASHVSDDDYEHARKVYNHFKCKNMGEYSDLYLATDVLLLTHIFENFRRLAKSMYDLDVCHYFTAPGMSWDAMLKVTGIELDILTDIEKFEFIIHNSNIKEAIANNKDMKNYDEKASAVHLEYYDANNLYGTSMCCKLPYKNFTFVEENLLQSEFKKALQASPDSSDGYILEVDIEYGVHLHDQHNDFPFCPESKIPPNAKHPKLLLDFSNKKNYIIHYLNLQQIVRNGLKKQKFTKC